MATCSVSRTPFAHRLDIVQRKRKGRLFTISVRRPLFEFVYCCSSEATEAVIELPEPIYETWAIAKSGLIVRPHLPRAKSDVPVRVRIEFLPEEEEA